MTDPLEVFEAALQGVPIDDPGVDEREALVTLPADVWTAHPVLGHIRRAALSRMRSPDAVLACVLARRALQIHPSYQLPPIVGTAASLNYCVGLVASAGGAKSSTYGVAAELVPIELTDVREGLSIGSGEGLADVFYETITKGTRKGHRQRSSTWAVGIYVDEGETISALTQRNGSTTASALRQAWSGSQLGGTNVGANFRDVKSHSYRFALVVSFQYTNAVTVLGDAETGTAQRFLWAGTRHPDISGTPPLWPGKLAMTIPPIITNGVHLELPTGVADEIRLAEAAEMNGTTTVELLDTHRRMMLLKTAALVQAVLTPDDIGTITDLAWQIGGEIVTTSDRHRQVIDEYRAMRQRDSDEHRDRRVGRDRTAQLTAADAYLAQQIATTAERVRVVIREHGELAGGVVQRYVTASRRDYVDAAVARALELGWIERVSESGDDVDRYRAR